MAKLSFLVQLTLLVLRGRRLQRLPTNGRSKRQLLAYRSTAKCHIMNTLRLYFISTDESRVSKCNRQVLQPLRQHPGPRILEGIAAKEKQLLTWKSFILSRLEDLNLNFPGAAVFHLVFVYASFRTTA